MFFKKKIKTSLVEFISALSNGQSSVLDILALKESSFKNESYDQILNNPSDIASGVVAVKTKFNINAFGIFDSILIKEHDNGDIKYILYTKTRDYSKIIETADTIHSILGESLYNPELHSSFTEKKKVLNLTQGAYQSLNDELVDVWVLDNITILLQYRIDPMFEFSLFVTKHLQKEINRAPRKNWTIAKYLKNDFSYIFSNSEESKIEVLSEDETIASVKYFYLLDSKELNVFDKLEIQQGGHQKDYSFKKPTHLTFTSSTDISLVNMVEVIENLIKIYGPDNGGHEELEIHELDILEDRRNWTGRSWDFNDVHGIYDLDNPNENMIYSVWINYDDIETGLTLTILSYHNLIEYFVSD
ncbi:hypothetical protein [Flagellimonas meridianipacifica]|uniref:Uncharacterized protein n=1 Tax=Flagellimonas meridianipacifica TaxID=1080225 RepID=A0A2T0MA99_9FLAO|nr:hypothetical protein [Allomuricauda pacifica]PRX54400.1 hypothetical protein CLV81_2801 [Allomuricauda pacifica]